MPKTATRLYAWSYQRHGLITLCETKTMLLKIHGSEAVSDVSDCVDATL